MRKVKLMLTDLRVESFEVESASPGAGTVEGQEAVSTEHTACYTHCPTAGAGCGCDSGVATFCNLECPSWDGTCPPPVYTDDPWDWTCDLECVTAPEG